MLPVYRPDLQGRVAPEGERLYISQHPEWEGVIYILLLCGCLVTNDVTMCQLTSNVYNNKWQQRVSVCFVFASRTLIPRSTLVYRWSRLKEESPSILFEGKVE